MSRLGSDVAYSSLMAPSRETREIMALAWGGMEIEARQRLALAWNMEKQRKGEVGCCHKGDVECSTCLCDV